MLRVSTFLHAKVFTYLLNAYTDTAIGAQLELYIQTHRMPLGRSEANSRAREIIRASKGSDNFLRGALYAMVKINGLADYVYAYVIDRVFFLGVFDRYCQTLLPICGTEPSWFPIQLKPLSDAALRPGILWVERHNIETNRRIAQALRRGDVSAGEKVARILDMSKTASMPDVFVWSAARTQEAAAHWDRIFIFLLHLINS